MGIFLIILSIVLWIMSLAAACGRQIVAPALSYLGLLLISFAKENGYQILPVNGTILTAWLCMSLVVTLTVVMQPEPVRRQKRGCLYIAGGGLTGLAIGLLAYTFSSNIYVLYATMIVAVVAGVFFGFLLYTNTPDGRPVGIGSGNFFKYLLAKGFPTAITVMQIGVALVLTIAMHSVHAL
ncbi:MAG: hypothetical protein NC204_04120 [Candidatus Amulumruptor caecigallinarius]|nr:hypothetical protein [Candidatus Amulumruptor caecigallinarius]